MSGTFRSWRLGSSRNCSIRGGCSGPKILAGCIKTRHPCPSAKTPPASSGQIGSAYNESTSMGLTVSSRSSCCGFLSDTVMVVILSVARGEPKSNGARRNRAVDILGAQQLPPQVIHIKQQNRLRISPAKFLHHALFPAIREIWLGIHVLGKKPILVRHAQEIQHRPYHVQMGNQNRLRQIFGKILVSGVYPIPEFRDRFAQTLRIDLREVCANLES